jgi:hypothetical protein
MAEQTEQNAAAGQSHAREIHPIERRILLPGGGELHLHYRLVKGSYTRPDERRGSFGYNPLTKKIETYFSTLDEAAMEITIRNLSDFQLKHVYLTDVHPFYANDDESPGEPADKDRLPDGNYLFEVLPTELYFGSFAQDEARTKYLGVVTRGVRPGQFLIRFDVKYEIVNGSARVHLPLSVNPD